MRRADQAEAQRLLAELLDAVGRGNLAADGPVAVALVRRLEGVLIALRTQQGDGPNPT